MRGAATTAPVDALRQGPAVAQRLLDVVLFITVLTSFIAFVEPSPHDALMFVLLATCVTARVHFDRKLVPLLLLLSTWLAGGLLCLINVGNQAKPIQYAATSAYLAIAALTFACLFSDGNMRRLAILRRAYILAALAATATGFIGFFHLVPDSGIFLDYERVSATFKDPNVYGPFLIFPILCLTVEILTRRMKLLNVVMLVLLLGGLLLSFSRGAWGHTLFSTTLAIVILLAVTPERRTRARIVVLALTVVVLAALLLGALMSIGSVHDMIVERAKAIQPYDVGPGGRFWLQQLALKTILDNPNGLGPFEFDRIFGLQQHNVYMQCFLVYGWIGGAAYLTLVVVTIMFGLVTVSIATPWQYYLITAYAVFVGEAFEGMIIDTDHWRYFFLMLGLIWGLGVATINFSRRPRSLMVDGRTRFATAGA
jgi:hypothetical protein